MFSNGVSKSHCEQLNHEWWSQPGWAMKQNVGQTRTTIP